MATPDKLPEGAFGPNSVRPQRVGRYKVWLLQKRFAELSAQVEACVLEARQLVAWKQTFQPLQVADLTDDDRRIVEHNRRARLVEIVQKHCSQALKAITQHKWAFPFNTPVDTSRFVDYLKVVVTPMDFSTIRNRTESGYYRDPKDWWSDVMLVFSNAKRYNAPGSDCHLMAQTLQEVSEEKYEKLIAPRLAEEAAATQREELHLRKRRAELANGQVAEAMDAQCGMLFGLMAELHAAVREAKAMAASLCEPLTLEEKQALAATIQGLPTAQLESIVAFVASRHPPSVSQSEVPAGGAPGGAPQPSRKVQLNLGRYDPLLLRQLQHLAATCTATTALRQQQQQQQQAQQGQGQQGQGRQGGAAAGGLAPLGVVMPPRMPQRVASPSPPTAAAAAARPATAAAAAAQPGQSSPSAAPGAAGAPDATAAAPAAAAAASGPSPAAAAAAAAPAPGTAATAATGTAAPSSSSPAAPGPAGTPAAAVGAAAAAAAGAAAPPAPMAPPPLGSTQRNIADVVTNATASGVSARAGIKWPGQAVGAGVRPRARALLSLHADGPANAGEMVASCPLPQPVPLPAAPPGRAAARGLKRKPEDSEQAAAPQGDGKAAVAASGTADGAQQPAPAGADGSGGAMDVDEK